MRSGRYCQVFMLGYATGAAMKEELENLAISFLRLANKLNMNNPNWIRYEIPEPREEHGDH